VADDARHFWMKRPNATLQFVDGFVGFRDRHLGRDLGMEIYDEAKVALPDPDVMNVANNARLACPDDKAS
jgi:hypothetical protein